MPVLAFDTETTGLINYREGPDHPSQPHLVQLACVLYDDAGERELATLALIVRPEGYDVPAGAAAVHGISTALAAAVGVPLVVACAVFSNLVKVSTRQVAHNLDFDIKVMTAAFHRLSRSMPAVNGYCTKELAAPVINLPPTPKMVAAGFNKPKAPTLTECFRHLFDSDLIGAHDALVDARGCARVYFELLRRAAVK